MINIEDQQQAPMPVSPAPLNKGGGGGGPKVPDVKRPDISDLMKRMKRVDPDSAQRYRQTGGE